MRKSSVDPSRYRKGGSLDIAAPLNASTAPEDIEIMLTQKADKIDLKNLHDIKSNKVDTEQNMRSIDILHKQITHIIVLLIELLKTNVTQQKESQVSI